MFKRFFKWVGSLIKPTKTTTVDTSQPGTVTTVEQHTPAEVAETDVQKAIDIVNKVKSALGSPAAVLITDIIPSDIDNKIRENLLAMLPKVAAGLTFMKDELSTDLSTAFNQVLSHVRFSADAHKDAFYHTLAAKMLMVVSDGKVSWSKAVIAVEYVLKEAVLTTPDTEDEPAQEVPATAPALPAA